MILFRAWLLWEQFQKKSELFRENVLLVPHGDDFRYSDPREWEKQFRNLEKLMAYINSNAEMNTKVLQGFLFVMKINHSTEVFYQLYIFYRYICSVYPRNSCYYMWYHIFWCFFFCQINIKTLYNSTCTCFTIKRVILISNIKRL